MSQRAHGNKGTDAVSKPQSAQDAADLSEFVQNLLQQMQGRFQTMSDSIISRVDEMGSKIDDLEKQIGDLVQQSGVDDKTQRQTTKRQSS
ncbi:hypothetical protein ABBQ38_003136 [Trebouxia sp. C0009 RCD-2024]